MIVKASPVDVGVWEWKDVTVDSEVEWVELERIHSACVHVRGDGAVEMRGSLYRDDSAGMTLCKVILGLDSLPFIPWRVKPRVLDGTCTVRLYAIRG